MKRIVTLLVLVLICVGAYYGYAQYKTKKNLDDGAVTGTGLMTPEQKTRFDAENNGDTPDGTSERKHESARQTAADVAVTPDGGSPVTNQTVGASAMPVAAGVAGAQSSTVQAATMQAEGPAPVSDTIKPNPTNGMVFAGSGTYQWYRQGNLTWRVNTATGVSCIVYATMDEWRKSIVLNHGCGGNA